ncbi:hypothetical protein H4219_004789 [Mycoemilia scoparia]|uniref:Uncharacterized protein n=1 Tax=Mycoemilia scoparia TaxID=417184 RepID=A0A9W8DQS1_9FUNG|nr:hypothetical protein H4219_004789 [Mycoemilia scoparia]
MSSPLSSKSNDTQLQAQLQRILTNGALVCKVNESLGIMFCTSKNHTTPNDNDEGIQHAFNGFFGDQFNQVFTINLDKLLTATYTKIGNSSGSPGSLQDPSDFTTEWMIVRYEYPLVTLVPKGFIVNDLLDSSNQGKGDWFRQSLGHFHTILRDDCFEKANDMIFGPRNLLGAGQLFDFLGFTSMFESFIQNVEGLSGNTKDVFEKIASYNNLEAFLQLMINGEYNDYGKFGISVLRNARKVSPEFIKQEAQLFLAKYSGADMMGNYIDDISDYSNDEESETIPSIFDFAYFAKAEHLASEIRTSDSSDPYLFLNVNCDVYIDVERILVTYYSLVFLLIKKHIYQKPLKDCEFDFPTNPEDIAKWRVLYCLASYVCILRIQHPNLPVDCVRSAQTDHKDGSFEEGCCLAKILFENTKEPDSHVTKAISNQIHLLKDSAPIDEQEVLTSMLFTFYMCR